MTDDNAAARGVQLDASMRAFNAEFAHFCELNPRLVESTADRLLAERVARAFWNLNRTWAQRRLAAIYKAGIL